MKKKKQERKSPPVITGHDSRPWERSAGKGESEKKPEAPDGISGDWG